MPPEWVLQQWPDDGSAGNRFVLAFWFVCLPLYWIYLTLVVSQMMGAGLGQAIGQVVVYLAFVLAAILVGIVFMGVIFVIAVLAIGATVAAIQHARASSD